jgi:hypothetical protein
MVMLIEALTAERDKRQQSSREEAVRRQMGREVLRRLGERLTAAPLPGWYFLLNGEEITVIHIKNGAGPRQRVGAWVLDEENRLTFGSETTEWITTESWARVIDKAVVLTAQAILDHESADAPQDLAAHG